MELNSELYSWLRSLKVLKHDLEVNNEGMYTIPESESEKLEYGLNFTPILKRVNRVINKLERETTPMPELNTLKEVKSPAAKLYNWKILSTALATIGVTVDPDSRSLIVAGDRQIVIEVLKQIHEAEKKSSKEILKNPNTPSARSSKSVKSSNSFTPSKKRPPKPPQKSKNLKGGLYIDSIDPDTDLSSTSSCLEYLLISFCNNFKLKPKQSAGLLTQSGKYLEHVICKGLKGKHKPIHTWYQEIFSTSSHLVELIQKEEVSGSVPMMLSALRSGFNSKSIETAQWCCRVFSKLASELIDSDLLPPSWDWYVSDNGGLEACLECLSRFKSEMAAPIVNVMAQFARNNFVELFTIQLRNFIPDSHFYFSTMNELLKFFCEIRTSKQELITGGIVEYWFDFGIRESHADSLGMPDVRLSAINFLCDLWMEFPGIVEGREEIGSQILNNVKRALRDKTKLLPFACIGKMFQMIENFSVERNTFAPIIYKTLTFFVVENFRNVLVREMVLINFSLIFEANPAIPIAILLEPLIKQLQVTNELRYSTCDFEFFVKIGRHPRLSLKNSVQTMDILGKVYMSDEIFAKAAAIPLKIIASRFIDSTSIQEYLFRLIKYSLGLSDAYELRKKVKNPDQDWEQRQKVQRDLVLELIQDIIKLKGSPLNERILESLCESSLNYKKLSRGCPEYLINLLKLFGNYKEILLLYENDKKITSNEDLDENSDQEIQENPKIKQNKNRRLEKASNTESTESLPRKGRIMMEIEKIRQNLLEKKLEKQVKEENDKVRAENRRKALRKQLEKRKLELGVQGKNTKNEERVENFFVLKEMTAEETEVVGIVLKRYSRVLKLLFKKYSSTGYNRGRVGKETFETAADKNSSLSESEFYKLLKEQGILTSMISPEESNSILKSFCHKQKKPSIRINFQEFQEMITQVSIFIFSKPPKDFSHLPPAISLKSFFDYCRTASGEKGVSTKFYDEPDAGVGDREIVRKLNILLEKDPNTILPEGYKKIIENEIEIVYEMPKELNIPESFFYAIWTLDGILGKSLGIHILEPIIKVKQVTRARGVLVKPLIGPGSRTLSESSKFEGTSTTFQRSYQPAMAFELNLTSGIKFEVARLTGKYPNDDLYESAKLLDDLLHTVDAGSYYLISRNTKQKIVNKVQMVKEQTEAEKKNQAEAQEKRRRLRKQLIQKRLEQAKEAKMIKTKEENEKKKKEEEKIQKIKKKRSEKNLEMKKKREAEIEVWKEKKRKNEEEEKEKQRIKKEMEKARHKVKREQFLKAVKENIKASETTNHREKAEEETKQKENLKKLENLKEMKRKQLEQKLLKNKAQKEEQNKQKENFEKLKNDENIRTVFNDFEKSLQLVFNHYCKVTPSKDGISQNELTFPGFNKFFSNFNIVPGLIPNDECLKMFRLLTKGKKQSTGASINYDDFLDTILTMSMKFKEEISKSLSKALQTNQEMLEGLLEYLSLSKDPKKTRDILKDIDLKSKNLHPRDKKKLKNELNKSISREMTPIKTGLNEKKSSRKESDSLSFLLKSGLSD
jgi:hypothetical protein